MWDTAGDGSVWSFRSCTKACRRAFIARGQLETQCVDPVESREPLCHFQAGRLIVGILVKRRIGKEK